MSASNPPASSPIYRWYVLLLLAAISAFSLMDRQLPFVLAEAIKADLDLTDTELGLIGGLGFSIFYTVFSLPLARLADRTSRKWVVTGVLALWSGATALSGLAQNFMHLFVSRAGVAIGEAGAIAPSHSIIAGYFEPGIRATAMALFLVGSTVGVMLGFWIGGWIGAEAGWRAAFFLLGVPGILLAVLAAATLRDAGRIDGTAQFHSGMAAAAFRLLRIPSYRNLTFGASLHGVASSALFAWLAAFLMRRHGFDIADAGLVVGLLTGVAGSASIAIAGLVSDRLSKRDQRWQMWLPAAGVLVGLPLYLLGITAPAAGLAIGALAAACLVCTSYAGPVFATVQDLATPADRSVASAIVVLVVGLIGGGIGPSLTGALSDILAARLGHNSLGAALAIVIAIGHVTAALFFWRASQTLQADLKAAELAG